MKTYDTLPNRASRTSIIELAGWLAAVTILVAGCKEYRISQAEFMAMQQPVVTDAEGTPATQPSPPSTITPEEEAIIDRELGPYRVGPNDLLGVEMIGAEQAAARSGSVAPVVLGGAGGGVGAALSGIPVRVNRKGEIRLPQVGTIQVGGLELQDVETKILDALIEKNVYTDREQITVNVTVALPYTVEVLVQGAATIPGVVRLRRGERTPLFALSSAGGATQIASGKVRVKRLRRPDEEVTLDLYDPEELKAALTMAPLENGDIVEVLAAQPNTVFVGGLVNLPGPQTYPAGTHITVLQALAAASGLRTDIFPTEATLIRRVNGHDVHVKLNLNHIEKAKEENLTLAAGDVLWVPFTVETRIQDWINKNMFFRMGASATADYNLNYSMPGVDYLNNAARQAALLGSGSSRNLQDTFDPFGFLLRNQALQNLQAR